MILLLTRYTHTSKSVIFWINKPVSFPGFKYFITLQAFASKYKLPYTLLSDEGNKVRKDWGVPGDLFGALPGRQTYVLDKNGVVQLIYNNQFQPEKHIDETLKFLKAAWSYHFSLSLLFHSSCLDPWPSYTVLCSLWMFNNTKVKLMRSKFIPDKDWRVCWLCWNRFGIELCLVAMCIYESLLFSLCNTSKYIELLRRRRTIFFFLCYMVLSWFSINRSRNVCRALDNLKKIAKLSAF